MYKLKIIKPKDINNHISLTENMLQGCAYVQVKTMEYNILLYFNISPRDMYNI